MVRRRAKFKNWSLALISRHRPLGLVKPSCTRGLFAFHDDFEVFVGRAHFMGVRAGVGGVVVPHLRRLRMWLAAVPGLAPWANLRRASGARAKRRAIGPFAAETGLKTRHYKI